jgi:hypothetical protein
MGSRVPLPRPSAHVFPCSIVDHSAREDSCIRFHICSRALGADPSRAWRLILSCAATRSAPYVLFLLVVEPDLGHESLGTAGRYLTQLGAGENRLFARLSKVYGLEAPAESDDVCVRPC